MDLKLKEKVAVITGGSVGIGLGVAEGLAAEGVHLALCACNEERLREAGERIRDARAVRVLTVAARVGAKEVLLGGMAQAGFRPPFGVRRSPVRRSGEQ